jgi:hypothetical protein
MIRGIEALDGLETRALKLHTEKNPRPDWANAAAPSTNELPSADGIFARSSQHSAGGSTGTGLKARRANTTGSSGADNEQDLIDLEIRRCVNSSYSLYIINKNMKR